MESPHKDKITNLSVCVSERERESVCVGEGACAALQILEVLHGVKLFASTVFV